MSSYSKEQLEKMVNSRIISDRCEAASQGYGLERLVNDKRWEVRYEVSHQGYGLE